MLSDDRPGTYRKICKGTYGVRTKRVSVLIGNHKLIGAAQTHSVNDPNGVHQVPDSHHSHDREE